MNEYEVLLYPQAYRDIEEIYKYLALVKMEPSVARNQTDRIWDAIDSLESMPYSHQDRLVGRYACNGYKQLLIDNYIAVYRINEEQKRVYIITVQYGGRQV